MEKSVKIPPETQNRSLPKRFGDRKDGWLLTKLDPISKIIPYIMRTRNDAQVFFEDSIDMSKSDLFIRNYRKEYKEVIGYMHIVIASMVRLMAERPKVNRFVIGGKIYARKEIAISLIIKKSMTLEGEEAAIKIIFPPDATLPEIVKKINDVIKTNKIIETENESDILAKVLSVLPSFIVSSFVRLVSLLDRLGLIPKSIHKASPFHTSIFITNVGSLGIKPVDHHIYNFGTTSIFLSLGAKRRENVLNDDGSINKLSMMDLKINVDERICDGFYYASTFKLARKYFSNPELLMEKPSCIVKDNDI